jgi:hypothetical protein
MEGCKTCAAWRGAVRTLIDTAELLKQEVEKLAALNAEVRQQLEDEVGAAWELAGDVRVTAVELWAREVGD